MGVDPGASQMKHFTTNKLLINSVVSLLASFFAPPLLELTPGFQSLGVSTLMLTLLRVALVSLATYLFYTALVQSADEDEGDG